MLTTSCTSIFRGGAITRVLGAAALIVGLGFTQQALAVKSPSNCNANNFQITLNRSAEQAVPGATVTFGVSVSNLDAGSSIACDVTDVTVIAQCPDADNNVPPTTSATTLVSGATYANGTADTPIGSIDCVIPTVSENKAISAYSRGDGLLLDSTVLAGSPFSRANTITVTVTPCAVKVDKQVSCDNGVTWVDPELVTNNEDGTEDCSVIGLTGPVMVRYQAQNTSTACTLTECVLQETNGQFGTPPLVGTLDPGQVTDFLPAGTSPVACNTAFGDPENPNEPNTVEITCQTGGDPVTASDTASFNCLAVDAQVDRQVTCDEGSNYADPGLERSNEDGTNGCTAIDGDPINWRYQGCNAGTAPLYDCTLVDQNTAVSDPIVLGNLAPFGQPGDCSPFTPATGNSIDCSNELEASEAPDQGKVTMTCCTSNVASIAECDIAKRVVVYDASTVTCTTPSGLNAVKECLDTDANGIDDNVRVVASATAGDVGFVNCTAQDTLHRDNNCESTGESVALTPEGGFDYPFSLAPEGSKALFGTIDPALTSDACNTASVTCTVEGTSTEVTATAPPVECNWQGGECWTRTPGFWGNRPNVTAQFLDVEVCGTTLDNVAAGLTDSAIEAMCSTGTDMKVLGQQKTQLIRQCTAAALNIAATAEYEGDCTDVYPDLGETYDACCGDESICTDDSVEGYSIGECIYRLDEFNNSQDTSTLEAFEGLGKALPATCKTSRGNGIVVHPTP